MCLHHKTQSRGEVLEKEWMNLPAVQVYVRRLERQLEQNSKLKEAFRQVLRNGNTTRPEAELLETMGLCKSWDSDRDEYRPWWDLFEKTERRVKTNVTCKLYRRRF